MNFDEHARATLIAYYLAHKRWKDTPPQHKTDKGIAKGLRDTAHSKLIGVAELLAQKEN
jgi:hypothetical protein